MTAAFIILFTALVLIWLPVNWGRRRYQRALNTELPDPMGLTESVRVDLDVLRTVPEMAAATAGIKASKYKKVYGERQVVGGVVVFGPRQLTWAPEDRARAVGVASWQLEWASMASTEVTDASDTCSAVLAITLPGGKRLELVGIDPVRARAALHRPPLAAGANGTTKSLAGPTDSADVAEIDRADTDGAPATIENGLAGDDTFDPDRDG